MGQLEPRGRLAPFLDEGPPIFVGSGTAVTAAASARENATDARPGQALPKGSEGCAARAATQRRISPNPARSPHLAEVFFAPRGTLRTLHPLGTFLRSAMVGGCPPTGTACAENLSFRWRATPGRKLRAGPSGGESAAWALSLRGGQTLS